MAAVLGNLFVPKAALRWFRELQWPWWLIPYRAFLFVGPIYYVLIAVVLYRSLDRGDRGATVLAVVVVIGNEAWNALFFGRRSPRAGFFGMLVFGVLVVGLLTTAVDDPLSAILVALYLAWVLYDVAWTRALWRLNRQ
nr:TspO/MBR family protein [Streptomyces sp. SID13031]